MTTVVSHDPSVKPEHSLSVKAGQRAQALADRLEQGARALAAFASALTDRSALPSRRARFPSSYQALAHS